MEKVWWIGALLAAVGLVSGWKANAGPTQCPAVNISIMEGSSEIILPDISSYPNSLFLRQKNHSSSSWKYIANIRNGTLIPYLSVYSAHFSVWGNGLAVVNASRFLTGEYQLCNWLTETCLQHFFLDVVALSSKRSHYCAIAAVFVLCSVFVLALVVLFARWWKQRRGRPAHPSSGVPDTGNKSLHPVATETEGTGVNKANRESGRAANGMV